ncbi:MAG: amidase [Spirochaetaceae bacterium]|nr:MAG: amidase [Spirochaetaceae bacterium]
MNDLVKPRDPTPVLPALRSGARSPAEEITCLLDRLEKHEPLLQTLLPDEDDRTRRERLLKEAEELERRWPDPARRPPLYGVVVGVKDLFHVAGFPTRAGSTLPPDLFLRNGSTEDSGTDRAGVRAGIRPGIHAGVTAESVRRLQEAGALVLGKTVTTEFAYFGPGPTRNPWNSDHTPGGSSSGSAAAVAAGFCHLALGTQTIGSISRPASFCGVAGYKPSFGRVSTSGVVPFSPGADHVGLIAPSARALEAGASALAGDWRVSTTALTSPPRDAIRHQLEAVLIPDDAYLGQAGADARRALDAVEERLLGIGVAVQHVAAFPDIDSINNLHQEMIAADFAQIHREWYDQYGDRYHERSRELVERGRKVAERRLLLAREGRGALRSRLEAALRRHEAVLWIAPATVGDAPPGIESTGNPIMNLPWTYSGLPTVSLPLTMLPHGTGAHGLPLGIQVAAPYGEDERLLAMAVMLESVLR